MIHTRKEFMELRTRPIHIVGVATGEGIAVLRLLVAAEFEHVTVHDSRPQDVLRKAFRTTHGAYSRSEQDEIWDALQPIMKQGCFGQNFLTGVEPDAILSVGQGWKLTAELRRRVEGLLKESPLREMIGMTELYLALHAGTLIAVTGTNGKSTTISLIDHLLAAAGIDHRTAGNERSHRQFLHELADDSLAGCVALLEVSNRQLDQLESISPDIAVITSLTPDHLEEHGGWDGYRAAKARLFSSQQPEQVAVWNDDDLECRTIARKSDATTHISCGIGPRITSDNPPNSVMWDNGKLMSSARHGTTVIAEASDITVPGDHNLRNIAVGVAAALAAGVPSQIIPEALRSFSGASLRLEPLGTVGGVSFVSDLKSTTPEAAIAAINAFSDQRVHLICGGDNKGLEYQALAALISERNVNCYLLAGDASDALQREFAALEADPPVVWRFCDDLDSALREGFRAAAPGDAVIVSPAAAGFWTRHLDGGRSLRSRVRLLRNELEVPSS